LLFSTRTTVDPSPLSARSRSRPAAARLSRRSLYCAARLKDFASDHVKRACHAAVQGRRDQWQCGGERVVCLPSDRPSHAQHRSTAACSQSPCASSAACLRTSSSIFRCFLCLWASAAPEHATHTKSTRSKQYATSEPSTMRAASRDCNPHQKESVGIRGHQRHSLGIRGNQRQSPGWNN
jgi:hypothetical protein